MDIVERFLAETIEQRAILKRWFGDVKRDCQAREPRYSKEARDFGAAERSLDNLRMRPWLRSSINNRFVYVHIDLNMPHRINETPRHQS